MRQPRRSKQECKELVAEFEVSGLSQAAFARAKGLNLTTLRSWIYKSRPKPATPKFVELSGGGSTATTERAAAATLVVGDVRVEFRDRPAVETITALVQSLNGASS